MLQTIFRVGDEVASAVADGVPVVAMESTIYSAFGLPEPANLECLERCDAVIRAAGAVPAMTAVLDGVAVVGIADNEVERVLGGTTKIAARDLGHAHATALGVGVTTVSASVTLAARAGVAVFATGGIGGVHRGFEASMDVSADLFELAHTQMIVVCSGPKVILDLPRTREALETMGVTLVGYRTDDMPAFWARHSGLAVDMRADRPQDIAAVARARAALGIGGSILVCNPVTPDLAIDIDVIEGWIASCIDDAPAGAAATPWLLAEIARRSSGRSLAANKQLIIDNAALAGAIAACL